MFGSGATLDKGVYNWTHWRARGKPTSHDHVWTRRQADTVYIGYLENILGNNDRWLGIADIDHMIHLALIGP